MKYIAIIASVCFLQTAYAGTITCYRSMEGGKSNEWSWKDCATKTSDGEFHLKPEFRDKLIFHKNGLANMCFSDENDGACYWVNRQLKGVRALSLEFSSGAFSQGLARHVDRNKKFGYFNEKLEIVIPPVYDIAMPFSKTNTAVVCKGCKTPDPKEDQNEFMWAELTGHWFVIDKKGKVIKSCGVRVCPMD